MAKPLTDTMRLLSRGAFVTDASEQFAELVRRVEVTGKPGKLTITLDVKRASGGVMAIAALAAVKLPEDKRDATLLWANEAGDLSVDNPKQQNLDLREVSTPAALPLRDVQSATTERTANAE